MISARTTQAERAGSTPVTILRVVHWVGVLLVWLGALICLFPLAWTIEASFRPDSSFLTNPLGFNPGEFIASNYSSAFSTADFGSGFKHTVVQTGIILISTLFFCPLAGYGFAKFQFRGRRFLFGLMMLTLFFVPISQYIPLLLELNNLGWIDTYQALVVPLVISSLGIFWMNGVIAGIPNELLHAARVDGCGSFSTWWRIVIPIIRPAMVSLAIFTFLGAYNDYFWPLLIAPGLPTIQPILGALQTTLLQAAVTASSNWGAILAGSVVVFAPTLVVFLIMQSFFLRGVLQGSLKE
jgi:multiple sugar transport system permease protein